MLELNQSNFNKEIQDNKMLVVDFWAEWCTEVNAEILIEDNIPKLAKEIKNSDNLLTYNGKEIISDKVKKSFTSNMLGHCKEIITESGRKIKVTDEHEFLTPKGWKQAQELRENDKVAVMPHYNKINSIKENYEILKERDIISIAYKFRDLEIYIKELQEKNLLPLRLNNKNILIITRLIGSLYTDGNIYKTKDSNRHQISFSLGTKKDVNTLIKDLEKLGFFKFNLKKRKNRIEINNRTFYISTYVLKVYSTSLAIFFKALGAPVGDKTSTNYELPKWLINTKSKEIKREFLAAFIGGDGPKIIMTISKREKKEPYNTLKINDIEFHKNPEQVESGIKIATQLSKLFKELDIKIDKIFVEDDNYVKKDGNKSKIIHIKIRNNFENAFNLYANVGYKYSHTKNIESMQSTEFIRRILTKRQNWIVKYNEPIKLNKEKGYGYRKLSNILNLHPSTIWKWVKKGVKPTVNYHKLKFPKWLKENTKGLPEELLWEEIKECKEIYLESVQKISMENNHNFIANGFLAHNCGPCKAVSPIFEELSKEMKDVRFAKLNVDDNQDLAQRLGVMGIPTFIIFKDGKEVGRTTGAAPKSVIKLKIEAALK